MPEFKIGDFLKHKLTASKYYYVGDHPTRPVVVISTPDGVKSYSIGENELSQYYELAPPERLALEKYDVYTNTRSLSFSRYEIRDTYVHPVTAKRVTFAWVTRESGYIFPVFIHEEDYPNFKKV